MKYRYAFVAVSSLAILASAGRADDPAPAATPAPAAAAPAKPEAGLPEAKSILDKYVAAIGGRDRLSKIKSRQMSMTMEMAGQGVKGNIQVFQAPPAKSYTETEIASIGKFTQGSNGEVVWESSSIMGTRVATGKEKASLLRGMRFNAEYDYAENYKKMTTVGSDKVGDREVYVVELVSNEDSKETRLFDKETGLLLAMRTTTPSQMGDIASETLYADYREVDGVKMAFKQTAKVMGNEISTTIEKVEFDVPISDDKFRLPDDVKAILEKQQPAPTDAGSAPDAPKPEDKK